MHVSRKNTPPAGADLPGDVLPTLYPGPVRRVSLCCGLNPYMQASGHGPALYQKLARKLTVRFLPGALVPLAYTR